MLTLQNKNQALTVCEFEVYGTEVQTAPVTTVPATTVPATT